MQISLYKWNSSSIEIAFQTKLNLCELELPNCISIKVIEFSFLRAACFSIGINVKTSIQIEVAYLPFQYKGLDTDFAN